MNLFDILSIKFPGASFLHDIKLQDDGEGAYIAEWNLPQPKPDANTIKSWFLDKSVIEEYNTKQNKLLNQDIYKKLEEIDLKSIRAIRSNDLERMQELEQQAVELRNQLL